MCTCVCDAILRVLPFESKRETSHLHQEFVNVHYVPVAKSFIDQVHISIKGDAKKIMDKYQDDVKKLASAIVDPEVKSSIPILKPVAKASLKSMKKYLKINGFKL